MPAFDNRRQTVRAPVSTLQFPRTPTTPGPTPSTPRDYRDRLYAELALDGDLSPVVSPSAVRCVGPAHARRLEFVPLSRWSGSNCSPTSLKGSNSVTRPKTPVVVSNFKPSSLIAASSRRLSSGAGSSRSSVGNYNAGGTIDTDEEPELLTAKGMTIIRAHRLTSQEELSRRRVAQMRMDETELVKREKDRKKQLLCKGISPAPEGWI